MKPKVLFLILFSFVLVLTSCSDKSQSSEIEAINAKVDSSFVQIADLTIEQIKIYNETFKDAKVTAAIQEYAKAKTVAEKRSVIDVIEPNDGRPHGDINTIKEKGGIDFISAVAKISPESFDLAIRNNDVVAKQVKLMNNYFGELNKETLDAVAFYEKMTKEDKTKLFFNASDFKPAPDYALRYIGREFQRTYLLQRLQVLQLLRRQFLLKRFVNEFPQGFNQRGSLSVIENDKQFDLQFAQR